MVTIQDIAPDLGLNVLQFSTDTIRSVLYELQQGTMQIDFDVYLPTKSKNLQRGYVWTAEQKSEFIIQIFRTYGQTNGISRMTPICIVENSFGQRMKDEGILKWQVIDGKQRLSTVLDFAQNKIPFFWQGKDYYFADLDKTMQGIIQRFWFTANVVRDDLKEPITDNQKIEWFRTVNFLGTPQDREHFERIML